MEWVLDRRLGVGILTWGLMLWAAVAYRRRHKDEVPEQTAYNMPLELLYTVVPLIMILGLFGSPPETKVNF